MADSQNDNSTNDGYPYDDNQYNPYNGYTYNDSSNDNSSGTILTEQEIQDKITNGNSIVGTTSNPFIIDGYTFTNLNINIENAILKNIDLANFNPNNARITNVTIENVTNIPTGYKFFSISNNQVSGSSGSTIPGDNASYGGNGGNGNFINQELFTLIGPNMNISNVDLTNGEVQNLKEIDFTGCNLANTTFHSADDLILLQDNLLFWSLVFNPTIEASLFNQLASKRTS